MHLACQTELGVRSSTFFVRLAGNGGFRPVARPRRACTNYKPLLAIAEARRSPVGDRLPPLCPVFPVATIAASFLARE